MRAARRARLALDGRRSARCRARSAFATSLSARLTARSSRVFSVSARRLRRQARNLEASGQMSQASAPAPARRNAPRLPCSTPYQAPATTRGSVAACRSINPSCMCQKPRRRYERDARMPERRPGLAARGKPHGANHRAIRWVNLLIASPTFRLEAIDAGEHAQWRTVSPAVSCPSGPPAASLRSRPRTAG